MKRMLALALACLMAVSLAACGKTEAGPSTEGGTYTPGTYTGEGTGFGGAVIAEVTFDASSITDIKLTGDSETPEVGGAALEELAQQVKKAQSAEIDGVSGATLTSSGVREAVADAIAQAEGKSGAAPLKDFTPGTYTGEAQGLEGPIKVEVTVNADRRIESVKIVEANETQGIGSNAVEQLPDAIVATQSTQIDGLSGATISSRAIFKAVDAALMAAGLDPAGLTPQAVEAGPKTSEELEADVVIVGGGGSGMTAAMRASELGLKVVLVEKMPFMGGAISISGGNQVVMGSQLQKDAGVTDDTAESMVQDFMKNGANLNVPELIDLYAQNVGATSDWLQSKGVTFNTEGGLHKLAEYSHDRELAYTGGGSGAAEAMRTAVAKTGATVLLNTRATELLADGGAVVGVKAESSSVEYTIRAEAVLLSTGGYGNNKDLLNDEMSQALYYGPVSSTGDGLLMAEKVNAATRLMEYGKRYPNGIEVSEGIAKSTIGGNIKAWTMSAILVNSAGQRVVNEKASNRTILETELKEPGQQLYLLMDQETFTEWVPRLSEAGISEADVNSYLEQNGATTPVFIRGNTLEEAAKTAGIDPAALQATVERYNGFVKAGVDQDFGRAADFMTMEIGAGPYYLVEQKPRFATTMGGLVVNEDLQVQDTNGQTIAGLYASGEVVGGVMGDDSPSGANNGWAVTSGKLAMESIAAEIQQVLAPAA